MLRDSAGPVAAARLDAVWPDPAQRARALDALIADGLATAVEHEMYALPGDRAP